MNATARAINEEHCAAVAAQRHAVEHAARCGELLLAAKAEVGHGAFEKWIETHCEFAPRTARVYMRLAKFPPEKRQRAAELSLRAALAFLHSEIVAERAAAAREAVGEPPPLSEIGGPFRTLYLDPPWKYEREHPKWPPPYPPLDIEELAVLEPPLTDDAVAFLWTTSAHLEFALTLLFEWRLHRVGEIVWDKVGQNPTRYVQMQHEILFVATRGNPPQPEHLPRTILRIKKQGHSEKPVEVYEMIEKMIPTMTPRLEMFARRSRPGWTSWGNQLPEVAA